jgi:hypothetical protein
MMRKQNKHKVEIDTRETTNAKRLSVAGKLVFSVIQFVH